MTAPPAPPRHFPRSTSTSRSARLLGGLLFLFIPLVLFLFVAHPRPLGLSLAAGVALMLGHRRLARPFMLRVAPLTCVWCARRIEPAEPRGELELRTASGPLAAVTCPRHREPAGRFFALLERWRWALRAGILGPLLALLLTLLLAALAVEGAAALLPAVTAAFQVVVGSTVITASLAYRRAEPRTSAAVPFPLHNFYLLGVRNLLWVFRVVGIWWIARGALGLVAALTGTA